ncbi:MAG: CinA family nicotinamide mononucleotide deamidase-related protein [Actinomycetota bacterium]|nr:CinA family nicotinamide mononucleotide deamidase-related protein [Actinomycetota bacterium]
MKFNILIIGSELTKGLAVDTNSREIALSLAKMGLVVNKVSIVSDSLDVIEDEIGVSLKSSDLLIITGGLGPTMDDLTREALAHYFGEDLKIDPKLLGLIEDRYNLLRRETKEVIKRQAEIFPGAQPILPSTGTAPGLCIDKDGKVVIALPGVPSEMKEMLQDQVIPFIEKRFSLSKRFLVKTARVSGINEVEVEERIRGLEEEFMLDISLIPHPESVEIHLSLMADGDGGRTILDEASRRLQEMLGEHLIGFDGVSLEESIGMLLEARKLTLAVAESCTGGLISKRITDVSGSSKYFLGAVVSYANEAKERVLKVSKRHIEELGAVSPEVALDMAKGVAKAISSDIGLSVTGIAGPSGGSEYKPVGTVDIALWHLNGYLTDRHHFSGSRGEIRLKSSEAALRMLRDFLLGG